MTAPLRPLDHRTVFVFSDADGSVRVEVTASLDFSTDASYFDVFNSLQEAAAALFLRATEPGASK